MIPVKAFDLAKGRLAERLDAPARARLAEAMATRVVRAAGPLPVWVVCDDPAVARWAVRIGVHLLWRPAQGLNHAVDQARSFARMLREASDQPVVYAELPRAQAEARQTQRLMPPLIKQRSPMKALRPCQASFPR